MYGSRVCYGPAVREALIQLREVSDRVCGERLHRMMPMLLPSLERHGRVQLNVRMRTLVLGVSAATIDRLLADMRVMAGLGRRRPAAFVTRLRPGWSPRQTVRQPPGSNDDFLGRSFLHW